MSGAYCRLCPGVSPSETSDIVYSVQFAQRAADGLADRFAQTRTWYGKYSEILENTGWVTEQFAFATHAQKEGDFEMDKAALGVVVGIATGNQLSALEASIDALKQLADADKAITLFSHHASAEASGNFQIGAVEKGDNGVLSMAFGGFYFRAVQQRTKFLFFKWGKNEVNFWTAAQKMTFNPSLYARVKPTIEQKLGQKAQDFIAGISLP